MKFDPSQIRLYQPPVSSHKGQNGKLLVIGGSRLFHSSIFWSADVAGKVVDLVHLTSPANENNQIFRKRLKEKFWNGIVVDWADVENYIEEDDAILIGPGMIRDSENRNPVILSSPKGDEGPRRDSSLRDVGRPSAQNDDEKLTQAAKTDKTSVIVNTLLKKYPSKHWVIDGGALQEVEPGLITKSCILTPHKKEFLNLFNKSSRGPDDHRGRGDLAEIATSSRCYIGTPRNDEENYKNYNCGDLSQKLQNCTILLKGQVDTVCQGSHCVSIEGGNPGMTKGGTGDVLAGLVAALYCKNDSWTAAAVASWVNKTAGDKLDKKVGPYFNAGDLVEQVPLVLFSLNHRHNRQM